MGKFEFTGKRVLQPKFVRKSWMWVVTLFVDGKQQEHWFPSSDQASAFYLKESYGTNS